MKRWYLVYCKRYELQRAFQHLTNQNVECFYPTIQVNKFLKDKLQRVETPLCPSYLFVSFDDEQHSLFTAIRSTRGVIDFVRFGPYPKEIPAELVAALKQYDLQRDLGAEQLVHTNLRKMKKMKKCTDIEAVFNEINGERREGMFMQLLSQYGIGTGAKL